MNTDTAYQCENCGAPLDRKAAAPPAAKVEKAPMKLGVGCLIGAVLGIIGLIIIAVMLSSSGKTEGVEAKLQSTGWERVVFIQELNPVTRQAFIDQIPANAAVGGCESRYHHSEDEPVENSVEACGTPYTIDKGSGYAEVVQDCVYEVFLEYCTYTVEEWQVNDQVVLQGSDLNPQWPNPQLEAGERLGDTRESYKAIFYTADGQLTYTFDDEVLYSQLIPGSEWILQVNNSGRIISIEPE